MSLFQFGFSLRREEPSPEDFIELEILESHTPRQEDTNLGVVEHRETMAAKILQPNQKVKIFSIQRRGSHKNWEVCK